MNRWWAAVALWIGVIFFSSTTLAEQWAVAVYNFLTGQRSLRHPYHGWQYLIVDKGFHVTLFFILALLLCRALLPFPRRTLVVLAYGAVVGSCSEYLQSFFPGRDPALRDVLINLGGTALGLAANSFLFPPHGGFTLKR